MDIYNTNLIIVIFPIFILIFFIYKYYSQSPTSRNQRNTTSRSSDSIPDTKERMKLFNERKEALTNQARMLYLKKRADATKFVE